MLQKELASILERMPKADKERRALLSELNEEVAKLAVDEALDDLLASFSDVPAASDYVRTAGRDLIHNVALFLSYRRGERTPSSSGRWTRLTTPASAATWST